MTCPKTPDAAQVQAGCQGQWDCTVETPVQLNFGIPCCGSTSKDVVIEIGTTLGVILGLQLC